MRSLATLVLLSLLSACASTGGASGSGATTMRPFGTTNDGRPARLWILEGKGGLTAEVTEFGATLVSLHVPGKDGSTTDVVLGYDDVRGYESADNQYFGCTVGRVANRIGNGAFELKGRVYDLATNDGQHHLHGGEVGFGQRMWRGKPVSRPDGPAVLFRLVSDDGDEGYPGEVSVEVLYTVTAKNELRIEYSATTTAPTPINLTHHSYFNLGGAGGGGIQDHVLQLRARRYTPVDAGLIPTGYIEPVAGTPLDFTRSRAIGERIEELIGTPTLGYDHNFVLDSGGSRLPVLAATLTHPASGRRMEVLTTEPGLQFYSGNFLKGQVGKDGKSYGLRSALCLEAQQFPDAVNQRDFPSVILEPGEEYTQTTVYRFL